MPADEAATATVMAIESEVFGRCVGEINVSSEQKKFSGLALLWAGIYEVYLGGKSDSRLAVEVGDGARYWRAYKVFLELFKNKALWWEGLLLG